ncbi:SDR family oxidoreductase [Xylophilus sp.]|uniref:SDR family oxidoreductase n=1 Tax=Xylophilus sp. TaxID=2653893 RepID=UPI002D7FE56B|nr:SDR family oxidoreductase [Xylophilus sp.]
MTAANPFAAAAEKTADRQAALQQRQDALDQEKKKKQPAQKKDEKGEGGNPPAVQAGAASEPANPLPAQHLDKPGDEGDLDLAPRFQAENYRGSGKLDGKVALITGGDSGIGRAVAVLFAREGADVAIVYLNEHDDAQETARHVEAEGRRAILIPGDVRDSAFAEHAVQQTVDTFGQLDVLVNNAAFQLHAERIEDIDDERLQMTLETNIRGYFQFARAAVSHLRSGSAIINTGSTTGLQGSAQLLDYSTTKGAIHAFTKALASNLIGKGIRGNAVAPGPVWTPLNPADRQGKEVAEFGSQTQFKRPAQPEELSPAYVFLASPVTAGYITGIVLPVTGSVGAI